MPYPSQNSATSASRRWSPPALARVERAVVQFADNGGRGVLIPGGYFLTAAHCLGWDLVGGMALGGDYVERARTHDRQDLFLGVRAVEPVMDVAVLGSTDDSELRAEAEAVDRFVAQTAPVPLFRGELVRSEEQERFGPPLFSVPALIFNSDRRWVKARASVYRAEQGWVMLHAEEYIGHGAAGGPIVTPAGELIGVVRHSTEQSMPSAKGVSYLGAAERPLHALPVWVVNAINSADPGAPRRAG